MRKYIVLALSLLLMDNAVLAATYPLTTLSEERPSGLVNLSADTTE